MLSIEYLAGYFDGEGCITVLTGPAHKNAPALTLLVSSGDREVVEAFYVQFGGSFKEVRKVDCVKRQLFRWRCSGTIANKTLTQLAPYLIAKKFPADLALKMTFHEHTHYGRGYKLPPEELLLRHSIAAQIKEYNQRVTIH